MIFFKKMTGLQNTRNNTKNQYKMTDCNLTPEQNKYLDFVANVVRKGHKLSKEQMQFAYIVLYQGLGLSLDAAVAEVTNPESLIN